MNHDYTPKEIADATVQASYQHPELRGLDIPPVKAILDALPEPTIMPRIDFARNSYAYQYDPKIMPKKTWLDHMIEAFKEPFNQKPKRNPITKVRRIWRGPNPITGRTFSTWYWQCALCDHNLNPRDTGSTHYGEICLTWEQAQRRATRHAHNHH